jgi:ubiquinone/menaquinone biosynthesis C-methylase UbiE
MEQLLTVLRACAEPTRMRLLMLAGNGAHCVSELTEILGQSQPRLSRHLRLLCEAGVMERQQEGANAWFALAGGERGALARLLLARVPEDDPGIQTDRRRAARVISERARAASEAFRRQGAEWDEARALGLPAALIEEAVLRLLPGPYVRMLDIGTGTGRLLEVLAPRIETGLGVDASRAMLALARTRLANAGLARCSVRQADMYRLPFADDTFDLVTLGMVLHHAEEPAAALAEAARVLRPGGTLLATELAAHGRAGLAHRWPGFDDAALRSLLAGAGLLHGADETVPGALPVRILAASLPRQAAVPVSATTQGETA